ncbi:GNAT family N-acetyltransferase [Corynebacterium halotolerans]|uniref:GNAT family N-acetyltransferase n=1 Tax=Corynebacterium halotolerans TaxID=225326 RepID=UPI0011EA7078|nr:GNAT family N-acetyltransferase [Corynebacterium halotolerans]
MDTELEAQWSDLAERCATRFASRPSYGLNWYRTLGKGRLAVATVHDGGRLIALLPLHARRRPGVTIHRWLGHGLGTVGEPLAEDGTAVEELVAGLHRSGVVLELTHIEAGSPLLSALHRHGGWAVEYTRDELCPVIDLPPGATPRDLRSAKTLSNLRRHRGKMARLGAPHEFRVLETPEEFEEHWPDIVAVAEASAEGDAGRRENLCAPPFDAFARNFLLEEARGGHLRIWGLTFGGSWAAFAIMLQTGKAAEGWFTRFNPEFRKAKTGHQLIEDICRRHDDLGITRVDMMIGRSSYKSDWQTGEYAVGTLRAAPRGRVGALPLVRLSDSVVAGARAGLRKLRTCPSPRRFGDARQR